MSCLYATQKLQATKTSQRPKDKQNYHQWNWATEKYQREIGSRIKTSHMRLGASLGHSIETITSRRDIIWLQKLVYFVFGVYLAAFEI